MIVGCDTGDLCSTNDEEEEVNGCKAVVWSVMGRLESQGIETVQDVLRLDDEAPSCPYGTGGHESKILG